MLSLLVQAPQSRGDTFYISDTGTRKITRIDASGSATVFVNINALGIALDGTGTLFAVVAGSATIVKIDPSGNVSPFANSGMVFPAGLAIDRDGNVYVSDVSTNSIIRFTPEGAGAVFATQGLVNPHGLAFDRERNLFVANWGANNILKITPDGSSSVFASGYLDAPWALAFDRLGRLYVTNSNNSVSDDRIVCFDESGNPSLFRSGIKAGRGLAFDSHSALYAANLSPTELDRFDASGKKSIVTSGSALDTPVFIVVKPDIPPPQISAIEMVAGAPRVTFTSTTTSGYRAE
ncbi:MAG: NHL repeat-containing protein, partial [Chthoniobacterales bacterium]